MNWERSENIDDIIIGKKSLILVYGANTLVGSLALNEILTHEELVYSERLRGEGQKNTWLSCRATLRLILGSFLNKNAREIDFSIGRFGKLYLPNSNLFFNVSHSKCAFLLGFSLLGRIGVDIELLNGSEDLTSLTDFAFSDDEVQYCQNGDYPERFAEIWTCKEAFLKAVGIGLIDRLPSISVTQNLGNSISRYGLNQNSFLCPNGETGSVVYRKCKQIESKWLIKCEH